MNRTLANLLERAGATYFETLLGFALTANALHVTALTALLLAAAPAGLSVLKTGLLAILGKPRLSRSLLGDVVERVGFTFAESLVALLLAAPALNLSTVHAAAISAFPSVLAVAKSYFSATVGYPDSASALPAPLDPSLIHGS